MLRYSGPFLFLAGIPLLYYFAGPRWPLATVMALAAVLVALETRSSHSALARGRFLDVSRFLPLLYIPLQLGVIIWAIRIAAKSDGLTFTGLALSVGVMAGDRKSTRLNSSHCTVSRMPSSA